MKLFLFIIILFMSIVTFSQTSKVPYSNGTEYDNPLFTNINLSNNAPAPQNEPSIRISRVNPNIVVAAWRDFRLGWDPNPVRRIGYTFSSNGGITWAASQLLPDPNPTYISQSDPVLTSDNAGNFYLSSTSRKPVSGYNRDQIVYKSTNNGQTFSFLGVGMAGTGGGGEDKEWMFCDPVPTNPTYNNLFMTSTNTNNGQIRFAKSTNGGVNWTAPIAFTTSGTGSNVCSGTGGEIYIVWQHTTGIRFDKSTNGGTSFGTDFQLSNITTTDGFPFICCDYSNRPSRGNVYVLWDDRRGGTYDIYFQRSTNAGLNWLSVPIMVNDVSTGNQYWPSVQCDTNGNIFVIYYDTRLGTSQVNSWIAYSTDQGTTWVNNRLSDVSFPATAVGSDARYGDYIGIDAFAGKVIPVWTDDRAGTPNQEVYTANLSGLIGIQTVSSEIPSKFKLYQNYPNPFNPSTKIKFSIKAASVVKVTIFDALGKEISSPVNENLQPGTYEISFNASGLSSGIYFYEIKAGSYTDVKKMIFVK